MKVKKLLSLVLTSAIAIAALTGCGSSDSGKGDTGGSDSAADPVVVQIGFENSISEPIGQALEK